MSTSKKGLNSRSGTGKPGSRRDFLNRAAGGFAFLSGAGTLAHASQSPEKFYPLQEQVSMFRGLESGCKLAEAFIIQVHTELDTA